MEKSNCKYCLKVFNMDGNYEYCSEECEILDEKETCKLDGCDNKVKTSKNKYCSRLCANKAKMNRVESKCLECGHMFESKESKNMRYCSNLCKNKAHKKNREKVKKQQRAKVMPGDKAGYYIEQGKLHRAFRERPKNTKIWNGNDLPPMISCCINYY